MITTANFYSSDLQLIIFLIIESIRWLIIISKQKKYQIRRLFNYQNRPFHTAFRYLLFI